MLPRIGSGPARLTHLNLHPPLHTMRTHLCNTLCTFVLAAFVTIAQATDISVQRLLGRYPTPQSNAAMGNSRRAFALSSKWALLGTLTANSSSGAVNVYDTATTVWKRTILPPANGGGFFGSALAGDTAVIAAPTRNSNTGAAYVYNIATGALRTTLVPATAPVASDFFGTGLATNGDVAVVGAPPALALAMWWCLT